MSIQQRKVLQAEVISDKMDKSIVVSIDSSIRNRKYGKIIKQKRKLTVHDEKNLAKIGSLVLIEESRPLSKCKSWTLVKVIS